MLSNCVDFLVWLEFFYVVLLMSSHYRTQELRSLFQWEGFLQLEP